MIYSDFSLPWIATSTTANYSGSLANAVLWGSKIKEGLLATGLTAVPCSGEWDFNTDPNTVTYAGLTTANSSVETMLGFFVVKMFSTTKPTLYLRVDFGWRQPGHTSFWGVPALRITMGSSVSSAGVLSGFQTHAGFRGARNYPAGYGDQTSYFNTGLRPLYISSDGENYLTLSIDPMGLGMNGTGPRGATALPMWFALERSIEPSTGAYDGDGFFYVTSSDDKTSSFASYGFMDFTNQAIINSTQVPVQAPLIFNGSSGGGSNIIMPITCCNPKIKAPMKACMFYFTAEIQEARRVNITSHGEQLTLMTLGRMANGTSNSSGGISNVTPSYVAPMLRYQ